MGNNAIITVLVVGMVMWRSNVCRRLWYAVYTEESRVVVCQLNIIKGVILNGETRLRLSVYRLTSFDVPAAHSPRLLCSVLFSVPDGRKIAQFATFVRPQGRTKVTN